MIKMYWWEGYYGYQRVIARLKQNMRPYVCNFGDQLSPFIIKLLTNQKIKHTIKTEKLLALGSIFFSLRNKDHVWGSGLLNPHHIKFALTAQNVTYHAIRGPKSRELLIEHGIDCPAVYGDPALLLPCLVKNNIEKKFRIGIVPHFSQLKFFNDAITYDEKIKIIDVEKPFHEVVREILACEIILSSSLHGIIVAEAYGIPAYMLTVEKPLHGDLFKFEDYFHATQRSLSFADFSQTQNFEQLTNLALDSLRPKIDLHALTHAFPFPTLPLTSEPTISWNEASINQYKFRSSIRPPYLNIPQQD